jgi:hypothetical protein
MITEQQQELAALFALGLLSPEGQQELAVQAHENAELRDLLKSLQRTTESLVRGLPTVEPPSGLKSKVLSRIQAGSRATTTSLAPPGLHFITAADTGGWKALPIPGAWLKLLSFEPNRGYAVLMGKLAPGARYPAHTNAGPEDFYILTGDLHVGQKVLGPGDFHHADAGSAHEENFSVEGCTLLAVLTVDDPLVSFART